MYITFDDTGHLRGDHVVGQKLDLRNLPKPDFMPTKLVRISDMATVSASDVNEGYCTLSYSWNQSGETIYDEAARKYKRIDEGKHKFISYDNNICPDMIIPFRKTFYSDKLAKIYDALKIMEKNMYYFTTTTKYVKFEGIVQHICQQFNIKYIWFDQMCINQDNKEEKHHEIRNMHHIYGNAHCTVALIPDYKHGYGSLGNSGEEYFKRLWTLEEAIKSERLLFVGSDVHKWGKDLLASSDNMKILCRPLSKISVAQILYYAHRRISTKEHDRVFALIHLFPEFMQHIDIDYYQPLEDLMIQFYGLLAKKDLSILLFTSTVNYLPIRRYKFLPSWTGVNGKHIIWDVTTSFQNYDIIGKTMHITSKFVTDRQPIDNDALTIRKKEDLPPPPADINDGDNKSSYCLCISVQLPESSETRIVSLFYNFFLIVKKERYYFSLVSKTLKRLSRFMETKKENLHWCHRYREEYDKVIHIDFDDLTEDVNDLFAQYIILSEVSFKNEFDLFYYPVIRKYLGEKNYKAIGCCKIFGLIKKDIFSDCNLPKQTFSIQ